jgi:Phage integrase family
MAAGWKSFAETVTPGGYLAGEVTSAMQKSIRRATNAAPSSGRANWISQGSAATSGNGTLRAESWVGFHTFRHTCATVLFRRGWNAVQVQRRMGHHSPSFTLNVYVSLLDDDIPEPAFFDLLAGNVAGGVAGRTDQTLTRASRTGPNQEPVASPGNKRFSTRNPAGPNPAEAATANF